MCFHYFHMPSLDAHVLCCYFSCACSWPAGPEQGVQEDRQVQVCFQFLSAALDKGAFVQDL
jgi:hypothetical protein